MNPDAAVSHSQREAQATDYLLLVDSHNPTSATTTRPPHYASIPQTDGRLGAMSRPHPPNARAHPAVLPPRQPRRQKGSLSLHEFQKFATDPSHNNPLDLIKSSGAATFMDRLDEWLVLELHKDGSRQYLKLTVRGLYRYVLNAVTDRSVTALSNAMKLIAITKTMQAACGITGTNTNTTSTTAASAPPTMEHVPDEEQGGVAGALHILEEDLPVDLLSDPPLASNVPPRPDPTSGAARPSGATANAITYRERLGGYLHPRDMRRLVTPFSTSNPPEAMVRRHVILLSFDPIRAIILRDRLLVLIPNDDVGDMTAMLENLEQRVRKGYSVPSLEPNPVAEPPPAAAAATTTIFNTLLRGVSSEPHSETVPLTKETEQDARTMQDIMDDEEFREIKALEWAELPFELQATDAVLHEIGAMMAMDTYELQTAANNYMDRILGHHDFNDDPLTIIRAIKDAVQQMTNRVNGFIASMNRILDDDVSLALMNCSRLISHPERFIQPVPQRVLDEESDEPQLILEANLHIGTSLLNYLALVQGQINTAKELVDQKQDSMRNRLLFVDMILSVFALVVALASMVGSFFGMNVVNGWESNASVFSPIVNYTLTGCAFVFVFIMAVLWCSGTIPHSVRALTKDVQLRTRKTKATTTNASLPSH